MITYALRALRKNPGYTTAAILTLALGIGANTAIFSVVNAVLLKTLPYPNPDRLVFVNESLAKAGYINVAWPDFLDWRAQNQVFDRMAVFQPNRLSFRGAAGPRLIPVSFVSADFFPLLGGASWTSPYQIDGTPAMDTMQQPWTALNMVMRRYFETLETPLLEGRTFGDSDYEGSAPVAVVSQSFARRAFPNGGAIGKRLRVKYASHEVLEVVGVVADIKQNGLTTPNMSELYVPAAQMPVGFMTLVVRTAGDPAGLARAATGAIQLLDKDQPVSKITPLTQTLTNSLARRKFSALLLSLFGGLAVVLAAVGVGGVMAYTVAQRTREIGIRMALGAQRTQVLRQVLGQSLRLTAIGVVAGLAAAWMLTRLLTKLLFGVQSHDALTFVAMAAALVAVALSACALPARKASRVDPMIALRYE